MLSAGCFISECVSSSQFYQSRDLQSELEILTYYLTIIHRRRSEYYSTIFTEPEENNCFSIIAQVIIRATAFSFILLVFFLKTSRNRVAAILKISALVL